MSTYTPDEMLVVLGFTVTIDGGGTGTDVDDGWESCTGGALNIEVREQPGTGTTTPGHKYIDEITLRGPLTAGRNALTDWINATVSGSVDQQYRTVVLKEILKDGTDGKTFTYFDCFPTRYVFPAFSAEGIEPLYEEITFKPRRMEVSAGPPPVPGPAT